MKAMGANGMKDEPKIAFLFNGGCSESLDIYNVLHTLGEEKERGRKQ